MIKSLSLILALVLCLSLCACSATVSTGAPTECSHSYKVTENREPTCNEEGLTVYTCSKCGHSWQMEASATGNHSYAVATCLAPKTCNICGVTEGSTTEHNWMDATFSSPKTCRICGATEGEAIDIMVTLKELRTNGANFEGQQVAVEGIITFKFGSHAFMEAYDTETDMYYGIYIYCGFDSRLGMLLAPGAAVRVVGDVVSTSGIYLIDNLKYSVFSDDPLNTCQISTGNPIAFTEVTPVEFSGNKTILINNEEQTFQYSDLALFASISMKNLKVESVDSSTNDDRAMILTCSADGVTVTVSTVALKDANGNLISASAFQGKTIDVRGVVHCYQGNNEIRVYSLNDIIIH